MKGEGTPSSVWTAAALGLGLLALVCAPASSAETPASDANDTGRSAPDTYTATTVAMTPADLELRIDVLEWSDEAGRSAAVAALQNPSEVTAALQKLPTLGYVWRSGSGVGYALKYAHRVPTPEGERLTFVTDKPLGAYDFEPWTAEAAAKSSDLAYSVIELYLDESGRGDGTLSLAAEVQLQPEAGLVSLKTNDGAPHLLKDAEHQPKPYWADGA